MFKAELRAALVVLFGMTLITGVIYPLLVTGIAQAAMSQQANGSLILAGDKAIGSTLIGQPFDDPKYFWGRLSGTSPAYNAGASSGTNYGPLNPALRDAAKARIDALRAADPETRSPVPVDLVTASASGLDPDISPAAALFQAHRVAKARGLDETHVEALVARFTRGRSFGVLGQPRVNVLLLNLALDEEH